MSFSEKILEHSNSYNYYKEKCEKLTKKNENLTKKNENLTKKNENLTKKNENLTKKNENLTKKNENLTKKNENLTKKNENLTKKNENLTKKLNSERDKLNDIKRKIDSLTSNFNKYKIKYHKNSLVSREVRYAIVFKDTIEGCEWLKNTTFSLNNSASNYSFMYTLFRILDETNPKNILELGLGQTTKLTTQYTNFFKDSKLITVEGDKEWIDIFSEKLTCEGNINIIHQDTEKFIYNETENLHYKNLSNIITDEKFDLIIIDGPNGFNPETKELFTYSRSNIWSLLDKNLAEDFVIIIDDYEREGEKNTMNRVEDILNEKGQEFYTFKSFGLKEQYVICSEKYKFVSWF